jgi:hypothetical protein
MENCALIPSSHLTLSPPPPLLLFLALLIHTAFIWKGRERVLEGYFILLAHSLSDQMESGLRLRLHNPLPYINIFKWRTTIEPTTRETIKINFLENSSTFVILTPNFTYL